MLFRTREDDDAGASHRVLPDGCVNILIERTATRQTSSVVGTMTRAIVVPGIHPRTFSAIRFKPGGTFGFLHVPMRESRPIRTWPWFGVLERHIGVGRKNRSGALA